MWCPENYLYFRIQTVWIRGGFLYFGQLFACRLLVEYLLHRITGTFLHHSMSFPRGGWGCEVSCGGRHRRRGKTNTGSALDGAVLDFTKILAYLVHKWADFNYIWGLAILADSLLFSVNNILAGLWLNCISSVEITLFLLADVLLQYRALFQY